MKSVLPPSTAGETSLPASLARWGAGPFSTLLNRLQRRRQPTNGSPPRFRSSNRDEKNDASRMDAVLAEVQKALRSVESERTGLERRLVEVNTRAASLLGNDDGMHLSRDARDERLLVRTEFQMMNAKSRLASLQAQQALLIRALDILS
jgi:hypothetical protein